jgi:hypothetical protein
VTVTTDRPVYRSVETAVFTVRNGSRDTLHASLCDSVVERATGSSWAYHTSLLCISDPGTHNYHIAPPGGTAEVELADHFVRDLAPGTFRLRLWVTKSDGPGLPDSVRTSTSFDVVRAGAR